MSQVPPDAPELGDRHHSPRSHVLVLPGAPSPVSLPCSASPSPALGEQLQLLLDKPGGAQKNPSLHNFIVFYFYFFPFDWREVLLLWAMKS